MFRVLRPFAVGVVHGLAGSAAVALLVLATIRDSRWALLYLFIFGAGTIAGMTIVTAAISLPFCSLKYGSGGLNRGLRIAAGAISVGFGLFLTYNIGFASGFFTNHPRWTPH
jgi:high-affinity nickel-transport protein